MNTIREVQRINEEELKRGIAGTRASWHAQYEKSAWVYVGNLDHSLVEGDVICVLSQWGEIDDFHLVRDEENGKSKGFAFCKYEDARSCVLAVDNFCGIELCGRSLRIDHVENFRLPIHLLEKEEQGVDIMKPGMAYQGQELSNQYSLQQGQDLFAPVVESQKVNDKRDSNGAIHDHDDDAEQKRRQEKLQRKEERRRIREKRERKRQEKKEQERQHRLLKKHEKRIRHDSDDQGDSGEKSKRKKSHKDHWPSDRGDAHRDDEGDSSSSRDDRKKIRRRRHYGEKAKGHHANGDSRGDD